MRLFIALAAIATTLSACDRQPPSEDPKTAAAEDNAVANLQASAQDGFTPGDSMGGVNLETSPGPPGALDQNIQ